MKYNKLVSGEPLSREKFQTPSKEFGIMPFWFWNGEMEYGEIEYQLREYKEKGCPGLYIHARFGIREELGYMDENWMDRVKFTIEKAQELGLQIWVYDEYNWPSGTCGQTLMQDHPEMTNVYLELVEGDLPGQFFTFMEGTDSRYNDLEQSEPVYACAIKLEDMEKGNYEVLDLMPTLSFDKVITWEAPKGPWKLFYFIERKSTWYADVLNPETTKKFLEYTHERYKASLGGSFSTDIKGFFTDEPAMHYFETGKDNYAIPWTRKMFKIFRERNGYDLKKNLPKLFFDCGGDTEQVRYDFWSTLTDQYEKSYFKQIEDWCADNDVISTGHLLYEESLRLHARVDGNLFKHLRHFHMTGVDHLYPRIGTREMENEHVALKIASSAAHQNGSVRLVSESMGGSYWDCTMERMKWIADWEYVLGVNQFIPHGFHYTIEGERKRDWPPSMFCQFTWWEQYGQFNEYLTRMGYVLSGGDHVAKVAILYPMNSIWANYTPQVKDKIGETIEKEFNYMADRLLRLHIDFDYIDEDVLCDQCRIEDGKLCIQGEKYEMLMLPPCTHIKAKTLARMEEFVRAGGRLGGEALLPCRVIEGEAPDICQRIEALFGVDPEKLRTQFLAGGQTGQILTERTIGAGKTVFVSGQGYKANDGCGGLEMLDRTMRACITPEIEIDSEEVFYLHRVKDGRDLFFLVNPVEESADITVVWEGAHTPEIWDLETGETETAKVYRIRDGKTYLDVHMEPFGSALFSFAEKTEPVHVSAADIHVEQAQVLADGKVRITGCGRLAADGSLTLDRDGSLIPDGAERLTPDGAGREQTVAVKAQAPLPEISLGERFDFAIDKPNSLNTDRWKMKYVEAGDDEAAITTGRADYSGWLDMRMGGWEMQLPVERDEEVYPVDLWYVTHVEAGFVPEDLKLMIDGFKGAGYTLYVNGRQVTETPERSYLDPEIRTVPMKDYFVPGTNWIAVKLTVTCKSDGMIDLLKFIGTFAVEETGGTEVIRPMVTAMEAGDWTKKKLPYYSGTGYYTCRVNLTREQTACKLMLQARVGRDVLLIRVNGKPVKTCLWNPYTADISAYVHPGENEITLGVVNTLMNLLESTRNPSGLFEAKIVPYNRYEVTV